MTVAIDYRFQFLRLSRWSNQNFKCLWEREQEEIGLSLGLVTFLVTATVLRWGFIWTYVVLTNIRCYYKQPTCYKNFRWTDFYSELYIRIPHVAKHG